MSSVPTATYTLRDRGVALSVETWVDPGSDQPNRARLLVDGTVVDEGAARELGHLDLGADSGHPTRVIWWWVGRVARCARVEPGRGDVSRRSVPYAPPAGTRSARVHAWGEAHPELYASRHVVFQLGATVAAILGLSVVIRAFLYGLLPRIDLSWLPDLALPEWLQYLDPTRYLAPLFRWVPPLMERLLGWIPDVELGWVKYVTGFLVAVSIAVTEVRRRKRLAQDRDAQDEAQDEVSR